MVAHDLIANQLAGQVPRVHDEHAAAGVWRGVAHDLVVRKVEGSVLEVDAATVVFGASVVANDVVAHSGEGVVHLGVESTPLEGRVVLDGVVDDGGAAGAKSQNAAAIPIGVVLANDVAADGRRAQNQDAATAI